MRLLASTGPLYARPFDWALGVIADAGYDAAELMVTQDAVTQDPDRVATLVAREGVPVSVVHGPFLLVTRRVFGTEPIGKARRSIELAGALGADVMVVHPPYRWQRGFHGWLLAEADAEADAVGTRVAVENMYPVPVAGRSVRFHRYTEPNHLLPFRHVVLDTSHLGVAGLDLNAAYDVLHDRTVHLHVSDNRGQGRDSHAPLGHGRLPLAGFLRQVAEDERSGRGSVGRDGASITLELDCRRFVDDRSGLVGYLRQEREKCLALLDGAAAEDVLGRPDKVTIAPGAFEDDPDQPTAPPADGVVRLPPR